MLDVIWGCCWGEVKGDFVQMAKGKCETIYKKTFHACTHKQPKQSQCSTVRVNTYTRQTTSLHSIAHWTADQDSLVYSLFRVTAGLLPLTCIHVSEVKQKNFHLLNSSMRRSHRVLFLKWRRRCSCCHYSFFKMCCGVPWSSPVNWKIQQLF